MKLPKLPVPHGFCACGQALHYRLDSDRARVEEMIAELGENITVQIGLRKWLVPRHYIALHGIKASELPTLGFPEIGPEVMMARE